MREPAHGQRIAPGRQRLPAHHARHAAASQQHKHGGVPPIQLPPLHRRPAIHARHLARVRYRQELKIYHLELRHWRHLLLDRQRLLRKLAWLERRLAAGHNSSAPGTRR